MRHRVAEDQLRAYAGRADDAEEERRQDRADGMPGPGTTAANAMKPRPAVMFCAKICTPAASSAPPTAQRAAAEQRDEAHRRRVDAHAARRERMLARRRQLARTVCAAAPRAQGRRRALQDEDGQDAVRAERRPEPGTPNGAVTAACC